MNYKMDPCVKMAKEDDRFIIKYAKSNHSKFIIRDGVEVIMGSANMDRTKKSTASPHYKDVCVKFVDSDIAKQLIRYAKELRNAEDSENRKAINKWG